MSGPVRFKLPQVSGLQCMTDPLRGALLNTLARVAARGGAVPYNVVRSEERP
ncbi:hypothetical protein F4557_006760 [Actinomadura catellatispora]|uniref:Uncharacterized protein n=1 Tax=Actinomadura livida TaxID=79909 RepID=A0A7W7N1W1_9ACTN|nr:hypothetical protein [Actinomadura catellatispora]